MPVPKMLNATTWPRDLLALYSATSLDDFIEQAFRVLPRIVPCDYVSVFSKRAGEGFVKERDSLGRVWDGAFMRRYLELTPAIPLVLANPGVKILSTRIALTGSDDELRRTAFYREVMRPQGWRHGVVLCFWPDAAPSFPILVMSLYRRREQPDFSDEDVARLEYVHPFLAPAVTRFHQMSVSDAVAEGIATALRQAPRGIVVLDWRLQVVRANLNGRRACTQWGGSAERGRAQRSRRALTVPVDIARACQELGDELQSCIRQNPDSTAQRRRHVSGPAGSDSTASITAICKASALAEPSFVIEFAQAERSHAGVQDTSRLLARLTKSEEDVALVVAEGLSNEEAAERLGKTIHAVKFLLHRIYRKLDVPNRARLVLLLRGQG